MDRQSKYIMRPCDCKCCMLVVEKTVWEDGTVDYDISMQDSRYDHGYNTLWGRLKRAARALFGKPVFYNDMYMEGEAAYASLLADMQELQDFRGDISEPAADSTDPGSAAGGDQAK